MDFNGMKRNKLQALCKKHKIPANLSNIQMVKLLSQLFKGGEKTILHGNAKNGDENGTEIESSDAIVQRTVKKVRFSPENELFEFTRPAEPKRRSRRTSVLKGYGAGLSIGHNGAALIGGYDESQVSQSKLSKKRRQRAESFATVEDINGRRSMRGTVQLKRNVLVDNAEKGGKEDSKRVKSAAVVVKNAVDSINDENLVAEIDNIPGRLTRYRSKKLVDNKVNASSVAGGNDDKKAANRRSLRNRHVVGEAEHSRNFEAVSENNGEGEVKILKDKNVKVSVVGEPHVAPRRSRRIAAFNDDVKKLENGGDRGVRKSKRKVNHVAPEMDANPVTQPENKKKKRKMRNVSREDATGSKIDPSSGKPSKQLEIMSEKTTLLHDDILDARETLPHENFEVSVSKPTQSAAMNDITKCHGKGEAASDVSENADELKADYMNGEVEKAGFSAHECSLVDLVSDTIIDRDTHFGSGKIDGLLLENQNAEHDGGRDLRISDLGYDEIQTQTLLERGEFTGDISTNSSEEKERSSETFGSAPIVEVKLNIGNEADKIVEDGRTDDQIKTGTKISDYVEKGHLKDDQIRTDIERIEEITEITHDVRISSLEASLKNSDVPHSFSAEANFRTVSPCSQEKVKLKTSNPLKSQEAVVGGIIEVEIQAEAGGDEISREKPFSLKENETLDRADVSNKKDKACGITIGAEAVVGIMQVNEMKIQTDAKGDEVSKDNTVSVEIIENLNEADVFDTEEPACGKTMKSEAVFDGITQVKEVKIPKDESGDEIMEETSNFCSGFEKVEIEGESGSDCPVESCRDVIVSDPMNQVFHEDLEGNQLKLLFSTPMKSVSPNEIDKNSAKSDENLGDAATHSHATNKVRSLGLVNPFSDLKASDNKLSENTHESPIQMSKEESIEEDIVSREDLPPSVEANHDNIDIITDCYQTSSFPSDNLSYIACEEDVTTLREITNDDIEGSLDPEIANIGSFDGMKAAGNKDKSPNSTGKISDERRTISESAAPDLYSLGRFQSTCKDTTEEETSMEAMHYAMPTSETAGPIDVDASSTPTNLAVHLLSDENGNYRIEKSESKLEAVTFAGDHHKTVEEAIFSPGFSVPELHFVETVVDSKDNLASVLKMPASECDEVLKETDVADTIKEYIDCEPFVSFKLDDSSRDLSLSIEASNYIGETTSDNKSHLDGLPEEDIYIGLHNFERDEDKSIEIEGQEHEQAILLMESEVNPKKVTESPTCVDPLFKEGSDVKDTETPKKETEPEESNKPSSRHLYSISTNNSRTILIHGTPSKVIDMKENPSKIKSSLVGDLTAIRPAKRTALQDLRWK